MVTMVCQLHFESALINERIPALLKISTERNTVKRLKTDIKQLNQKLSELQALLELKEAEILSLRRGAATVPEIYVLQENICTNDSSCETPLKDVSGNSSVESCHVTSACTPPCVTDTNDVSDTVLELTRAMSGVSSSLNRLPSMDAEAKEASREPLIESKLEIWKEEEFQQVTVEFQETFLGHTSPISRCRFSASGTNVASSSVDGTVRIWTYDSSTPASRNATIYCGTEIMSLEWESRSDRLLLIGTADGGIKAWNVDAKRVVCDLSTTQEFPSVVDLKCSPVEPIFVSAAASRRFGSSRIDEMGYASLSVWNMRAWKHVLALPLGKDPPGITALSFNHNGKILAASASDGMIHMFDISAGLQITGWPAHDSAVNSVLFGSDETSIFSLGSDGKILEWSLQNPGQILWSSDCSKFCYPESEKICRHEIALDSNGRRLLVTSGSVRSPIYQVRGRSSALKTLPHTAAITSVDWHPTRPIFLTGSADHSVRVTSIL
ncbi:hypothetical protein HPP92_022503 [Vanilla planifolia]|uniref:Anaphase-promoting complex subunit 4-like WD40 domain-containing protein n=1 Tax=Vanilla planifolia TaxID=51239 RepID=A0A835UFD5_VANPL|nr:hypothetical protein HPP92_022503 [Vanilla planifolia]